MHPYVLIPMLSAVAAAGFGATLLTRDPHHARNRYAAALLFVTSFWAVCEVLWNTTTDPELALWLIRVSAVGWIWIGPLWLRLFADRGGRPPRAVQRILPWMVGGGSLVLALEWTTPWMHTRVVRTDWGFAYEVGPVFVAWYIYCVSLILLGVYFEVRDWRKPSSPAERRQRPWIITAVLIPLVVASLTDGILPIFGIQPPRLGTASLTLMGALMVYSQLRYGYSLLAPGHFAREILDALPEGVALVTLDGRVRSVNRGLARLAGDSARALLGSDIRRWIPFAPLDPPSEVRDLDTRFECSHATPIPVAISTLMLRDRQGLELGLVVLVRDMREVAALRSRLVTSGRLAAVGQLAAGIAHEINNPLAFVRANLALLQEHWQEVSEGWRKGRSAAEFEELLEEGGELIAESLEGVDRTAAIVRDVKRFSHTGGDRMELVDVNRLLEEALRIVSPQLRGRVEVERSYSPLPMFPASAQELRQVFVNLLANASQAIGAKGTIRLATRAEAEAVRIIVEDDGPGIPEELRERIFDPFFTTKPVGEGTGLGLAISYEIVRRHGGEILVDSEPGRGTRFVLRFPLGEAPLG